MVVERQTNNCYVGLHGPPVIRPRQLVFLNLLGFNWLNFVI
jgi:hypothetical protein